MRPHLFVGGGIAALIIAFTLTLGAGSATATSDLGSVLEQSRIIRGFAFAREQNIDLNLHGKNLALVGLGSYIVNAQGGCNDCHTNPPYAEGGDPHAGQPKIINAAAYLSGGTPFGPPCDPNTPFSRNITPRSNGLPAGLTFEEFKTTLRTGVNPRRPGRILQVMPWPVYGEMTDRDLRAVYTFLTAIPSLPSPPRPPCPPAE
jgi:hypothetical protein